MLEIVCGACGAKSSVPDAEAGRLRPCPICGHQNRAPLPGAIEVPDDPPAAAAVTPPPLPAAPVPATAEPAPAVVFAAPEAAPAKAEPASVPPPVVVFAAPEAAPAKVAASAAAPAATPATPAPKAEPVGPAPAAKATAPAQAPAPAPAAPAHPAAKAKDKHRVHPTTVQPRAPHPQPQRPEAPQAAAPAPSPAEAPLPEVTVLPEGAAPAAPGAGIYDSPFDRLGHLDVALLNLCLRHAVRFLQLWNFLAGALCFCFFAGLAVMAVAGVALCVDAQWFLSPLFRAALLAAGGLGGAIGLLLFLKVGKVARR